MSYINIIMSYAWINISNINTKDPLKVGRNLAKSKPVNVSEISKNNLKEPNIY